MSVSAVAVHAEESGGLRTSDGRLFNSSHPEYILPADEEEHSRLDRQHEMLKLHIGGALYTEPELIKRVLAPDQGLRPKVLDVGTGSGAWSIDMAKEFPHADVVGMDIITPDIVKHRPHQIPSNCHFEIADAETEMGRFRGFSLVHIRCAHTGIADFHAWIYDVAKCLRPGGVLLLVSGFSPMLTEDRKALYSYKNEGEDGFTWYSRAWGNIWLGQMATRNVTVNSLFFWEKWLEDNPNFVEKRVTTPWMRQGAWRDDELTESQRKVRDIMHENSCNVIRALRHVPQDAGFDLAETDRTIQNFVKELQNPPYKGYIRWQYIAAVRSGNEWVAREKPSDDDLMFNPLIEWPTFRPGWRWE